MLRGWLAKLLALLLILGVPGPVAGRAKNEDRTPQIRDQISRLGAGAVVQVKFRAGGSQRGRLAAVGQDSFEFQTVKGDKIETRTVRFDQANEVKQVKSVKGLHPAAKVMIGIAIFVGVIMAIIGIACAAGANCSLSN
jgi:hypothetical protein